MTEIWTDIKGYNGKYQVSNAGRIKNKDKIMTPINNGNGYLYITLSSNGERKNHYIHRLVAETFLDNPDNKTVVNHKDYDKTNNAVNNLEWVTQRENVRYSKCNMTGKKHKCKTNTGEFYISFRTQKGLYRVTVNKKEYGAYKTLKEAITKRDSILKGVI